MTWLGLVRNIHADIMWPFYNMTIMLKLLRPSENNRFLAAKSLSNSSDTEEDQSSGTYDKSLSWKYSGRYLKRVQSSGTYRKSITKLWKLWQIHNIVKYDGRNLKREHTVGYNYLKRKRLLFISLHFRLWTLNVHTQQW